MGKIDNTEIKNILSQLNCWCMNFKGNINTAYFSSLTLTEQVSQLFWIVKENTSLINTTVDSFNDLYNFVNDYFDNLDVQNEINNKISEMVEDGSFVDIILPFVASYSNPSIVDSVSEMTDKNKIYVLSTSGNVWAWNGKKFADTLIQYGVSGDIYSFRGNLNVNDSITLSDYTENGYYYSGSTSGIKITDFPERYNIDSFILDNEPRGNYNVLQRIYVINEGTAWRFISDNTPGDWQYEVNNMFIFNGNIPTGTRKISDITTYGYYASGGLANIVATDLPDAPKSVFFLFNFPFNSGSTLQVLFYTDYQSIFWRFTGANEEWLSLNMGDDYTWNAFGDSITRGTYSLEDGTTLVAYNKSYANIINSKFKHKTFNNYGVGGLGYTVNGNDGRNALTVLQDAGIAENSLVTIALGVNDWNQNATLGSNTDSIGDETIYGKIKQCVNYVCNRNARLILITPFNTCPDSTSGTNSWGYGTPNTAGVTLSQICDAIIYVAKLYGVEYIDTRYNPVINNGNIRHQLYDNLHPSELCQYQIATYLERFIPN